jgi:hypothetical protein
MLTPELHYSRPRPPVAAHRQPRGGLAAVDPVHTVLPGGVSLMSQGDAKRSRRAPAGADHDGSRRRFVRSKQSAAEPRDASSNEAPATYPCGGMLLMRPAVPGTADRFRAQCFCRTAAAQGFGRPAGGETVLPLSVIETSHLMGSIDGVLLLLLAYGLQQRLRWAWAVSAVLLCAGAVSLMLKGFAWEEAIALMLLLLALLPARREFHLELITP